MIIKLLEEYGKSKYVSIIRGIFRSFLHNNQEELKMIKGSDFVFESVDLMDYKLHRVRLRKGGSCVKYPEQLANTKAIINQKKKDDECLRCSTISALNYNKIFKKEFENIKKKLKMKIKIFHHKKRTRKVLNKTMSQSLLMSYCHHKIVKK